MRRLSSGPVRADLIAALATARLTRLVVSDKITDPLRERFIEAAYEAAGKADKVRLEFRRREVGLDDMAGLLPRSWAEYVRDEDDHPPKLAYLVTCPWCVGIYAAALVFVLPRWLRRLLATAEMGSIVDVLSNRA